MLSRLNGILVEAGIPFFMIVLLAESKTMSPVQFQINETEYKDHTPLLEETAELINKSISELSAATISEILGVSNQMAVRILKLAYDFPLKSMGYPAYKGFTGEAYKYLDFNSIPPEKLIYAEESLRIISSLYGILRPSDIIKPYRLDFNKNCGPGKQNLAKYLKPKVTIELVRLLKEKKTTEVIDLLPADAALCIDWKIVRAFAKVNKVCFKRIKNDGTLVTPIASHLKELRGLMTRDIILNKINSFNDLVSFESDNYNFSPTDSKTGLLFFICD